MLPCIVSNDVARFILYKIIFVSNANYFMTTMLCLFSYLYLLLLKVDQSRCDCKDWSLLNIDVCMRLCSLTYDTHVLAHYMCL